jgi:hypothetical protein
MLALSSGHAVLQCDQGRFMSAIDPPTVLVPDAELCKNDGLWPVLIGRDQRTILAAPIILYDFPEVAPESAGDYYDATEIDEMLALRLLTLSDEEKELVRQSDPRARALLERTEKLSDAERERLHGRVSRGSRSPRAAWALNQSEFQAGERVRLKPHPRGGEALDVILRDMVATIIAVEQDFEGRTHLAVTLDEDPGRDLGLDGQSGHRFFFGVDEVERL